MEDTTGRIIGFVLLLIGMACLYWGANIYASLGISMLTFIGIAVSFLIKNSKKNKKTTSKRVDGNSDNQFDPSKVRPIEEFVKEAKMK